MLAWNRAAAAVFTDYSAIPAEQRNVLRLVFLEPRLRRMQVDWETLARFVVAASRTDVARAGASRQVQSMVDELSSRSPEFEALWSHHDIRVHGDGTKRMRHPQAGTISLEHSAFAVNGRPDLSLAIYTPATAADEAHIRALIEPGTATGTRRRDKRLM